MNQPKPLIPSEMPNKMPPAGPLGKKQLKEMRDKLNIPDKLSLKDYIALWLVEYPDKIELAGEALIGWSAKYDGWIKYAILGVGYAVKYAGKQIDNNVTRADDLK